MITFLIVVAVGGLIIGALGRLLVPGRNPMGILRTTLVGLGGSFAGGLVGRLLLGWRYRYSMLLALVIAVVCAAGIVYLLDGRRQAASRKTDYRRSF